jgi:DNA-binding protein YbaB
MFDMFSKLGEIKEKAMNAKKTLEETRVSFSNDYMEVVANGKKDILSLELKAAFEALPADQKGSIIQNGIQEVLKKSEIEVLNTFKGIVPNIPGLNLF